MVNIVNINRFGGEFDGDHDRAMIIDSDTPRDELTTIEIYRKLARGNSLADFGELETRLVLDDDERRDLILALGGRI